MSRLPIVEASQFANLLLADTALIDVRAPIEYRAGSIPNAVNLPLLNDAERHEVGKRYKANGQDAAIVLGNKLVSGSTREERTAAWQGFRTTQQWLVESGITYPLIDGGYKALRRFLIDNLANCLRTLPIRVIGGRTGIGKTRVLQACQRSVDLEGLAHHRGSSFGATLVAQPSNIDFENALSVELLRLCQVSDEAPIVFEDEARMIGRVSLPEPLRNALKVAPIAILDVDFDERVQNVLQDYVIDLVRLYQARDGDVAGLNSFYDHHRDAVLRVQKRLGGDNTRHVLQLLDSAFQSLRDLTQVDGFNAYIAYLLTHYYDPMYDYQIKAKQDRIRHSGDAASVQAWAQAKSPAPA